MKARSTILLLYIAWLIAAVVLVFAAAEKQPDSFYTLLRWICCVVFVYSAVTSFQMRRLLWVCIFVVLAALFNPIFPAPLDRSLWIVADWFSIGAMIIAAFIFRKGSSHMKRIISYLVITVAVASFAFGQSVTPKESADSSSEQEVRQTIEKYRAALLRRDTPALERIWTDDYFFVNAAGEMLTKAQRLANLKSGATTLESINEEEELKVRVHQNTAVATSRVTIKGQYGGQPTSGQYRSIHVWVKGPTGWQLVANQLTPLAAK
jgi:ketosteroid isomerase-like protein